MLDIPVFILFNSIFVQILGRGGEKLMAQSERRIDIPIYLGQRQVNQASVDRIWEMYSHGRIQGLELRVSLMRAGSGPADPDERRRTIAEWSLRQQSQAGG